ncbi:DUF445 domain-containing protein [Metabacillus halosaccharovorans]|uniref:DUF445 domain-containing protein n=1 Tax=Metabacillus halosaccharovorans TaxID=930124 RepID=UPI00203AF4AC|nr:DUF445 family protein [Metabacillus halosaccharovorans]MCM3443266.1 DUF445 family protein [Metabacillus halosaccharovorans]
MDQMITALIMIIVGAAIGGVTNSLAIKMLFRPYNAIYFLGKRVPFTPGLIPKRRDELATQLGKMVVEHLLTAEGIKRKFLQAQFQDQLISWGETQVKKVTNSEKTVEQILESFNVNEPSQKTDVLLKTFLQGKYEELVHENKSKPLQELLPKNLLDEAYVAIPKIGQFIIDKGISYFESSEGKQKLKKMIEDFLATRGMLGNMIGMFLGNESLVDKVQPEVLKFLKNKETHVLITTLIGREWNHIQDMTLDELDQKWGIFEKGSTLVNTVVETLNVQDLLSKPISAYLKPNEDKIIQEWLPKIVTLSIQYLTSHLEEMLKKLKLEEVVREQVETFAVDRLEDIILSISRREFKMITYLGALLGGIIGGLQAIIVMFIQ